MERTFKLEKKTLGENFDVVVVGGGLSGVMAAISAAREGKKVIVVEKYGFLGGMATAGLVMPFMGWFERGSNKPANAGLFLAMLKEMREMEITLPPSQNRYKEQLFKILLDKMVRRAGVKTLFHARLTDVCMQGKRIEKITVSTVSGNVDIVGKYFLDGTGNGDLFALAGLEFFLRKGPEEYSQPMTTCFNLYPVDWSKFDRAATNELYKKLQAEGKIKNPREDLLLFPSPIPHLMHFNTTRVIKKNPCDVEDMTEAEFIGREQTYEMYNFLKENFEAFKDSELIAIADEIGIRESRRIVGEYVLNEEDVLGVRKFEDSIARGTYAVDIHNPDGSGTVLKYVPDNEYYTIPYRSLLPKECDNLLVIGRAISSTHEAHAAIRIMPITSCIGEAAGIAAALAVDEGCACRDVDVKKMQALLTAYDALY